MKEKHVYSFTISIFNKILSSTVRTLAVQKTTAGSYFYCIAQQFVTGSKKYHGATKINDVGWFTLTYSLPRVDVRWVTHNRQTLKTILHWTRSLFWTQFHFFFFEWLLTCLANPALCTRFLQTGHVFFEYVLFFLFGFAGQWYLRCGYRPVLEISRPHLGHMRRSSRACSRSRLPQCLHLWLWLRPDK